MESSTKDSANAAKAFAKRKNGGLSARIREMLNEEKAGITYLVNERMPLADIQEFLRERGLKIGLQALRQYCHDNFNYPPQKKSSGSSSKTE